MEPKEGAVSTDETPKKRRTKATAAEPASAEETPKKTTARKRTTKATAVEAAPVEAAEPKRVPTDSVALEGGAG